MRVAIPHDLPRETVRERLRSRSHEMGDHIPGGMAKVDTSWPSEDRMAMRVSAMGQNIACRLEVFDDKVHAEVDLPPMLALFAGKIRDKLASGATKLLK